MSKSQKVKRISQGEGVKDSRDRGAEGEEQKHRNAEATRVQGDEDSRGLGGLRDE
jgi:hypothetical protein